MPYEHRFLAPICRFPLALIAVVLLLQIDTQELPSRAVSKVTRRTAPPCPVTFQWSTGSGVTQYRLSISKVGPGGGDLYNADPGPGLVASKTISGLPTDGSTIYPRVYSHLGVNWPSIDYTDTAFH